MIRDIVVAALILGTLTLILVGYANHGRVVAISTHQMTER